MRVADIKCFCEGTDTGSFLKEGDYSGVLSTLDGFIPGLESQIDSLNGEMNGGGLSANALNLGGFSPLFEMGYNANRNILSAKESISEIKQIIEGDANTHMADEWGTYKAEVQKCTEKKKKAMEDAKDYYDSLEDDDSDKESAYSDYTSAKDDYDKHVTELEKAGTNYDSYSSKASGYTPMNLESSGSSGYSSDGSAAQETQASIYNELSKLGYSRAGICAILANMQAESGFDLTAVGDGGTSFGLCQWHDSRWTDLNNYCAAHGLDPNTVEGQIAFLDYELQNNYPDFYNQLQNASDTQENAENLARTWCIDFERPAYATTRAEERAGYVGTYWDRSATVDTGADVISGYSNISSMNQSISQNPHAVKEKDYDTSLSTGQSASAQAISSQIAQYAVNNCPGTYGWCAGAVETAVSAVTGIDIYGHAKDLLYNGELERAGYVRLDIDPASSDYVPIPGDVVICDEGYRLTSSGYSEYGHAQMYTEDGWYSDHAQPDGLGLYSGENAVFRYVG